MQIHHATRGWARAIWRTLREGSSAVLLALGLSALPLTAGHAQTPSFSTPQWTARYGGPGNGREEAARVATDAAGNVFVTAASLGAGSDLDIVTIKYDPNGTPLWTNRFNGDANYIDSPVSIAVDSQGNAVIAGYSWRGNYFNGGTEYDYTVLKYSASGALLWVRYYNGPSNTTSADLPHSMALDAADNVLVTGYSANRNANGIVVNEFATVKWDPAGNQLWARRYHAADNLGDGAEDIKVDRNGNIIVSGGVTVYRGGATSDIVTLRYDASGNLLWARQFNGSGSPLIDDENAYEVGLDALGNVYVVGYTFPTAGAPKLCLLKYSAAGQPLWTRTWGTPNVGYRVAHMRVDAAGNAVVCNETAKADPVNGADVETVKWDANGTLLWDHIYDGPLPDFDENPQMTTDGAGNVYVGSWSSGLPDTGYDFTVTKYLPDGRLAAVLRYDHQNASNDLIYSLTLDPSGNLIVAGSTSVGGTPYDLLVAKFTVPTGIQPPPPAPALLALTLSPATVQGGNTVIGTVTLTQAAPAGGYTVQLGTDSGVTAVPSSVTVPQGATSAPFMIGTVAVPVATTANLSAAFAGTTKTAPLTVTPPSAPPVALLSLSLSRSSVGGGTAVTGTVTLSGPASSGGTVVALSSSSARASVPASVTVPPGSNSATFGVSTAAVSAATGVTLTATYAGISRTAVLTVLPPPASDAVTILKAEYVRSNRQLLVQATSTSSAATLKAYSTASGTLIGTLTNTGGGKYSGQFNLATSPANITVKSSLGGSAGKGVTSK